MNEILRKHNKLYWETMNKKPLNGNLQEAVEFAIDCPDQWVENGYDPNDADALIFVQIPVDDLIHYGTSEVHRFTQKSVDFLKSASVDYVYSGAYVDNMSIPGAIINISKENGEKFEDVIIGEGGFLRFDDGISVAGEGWYYFENE